MEKKFPASENPVGGPGSERTQTDIGGGSLPKKRKWDV